MRYEYKRIDTTTLEGLLEVGYILKQAKTLAKYSREHWSNIRKFQEERKRLFPHREKSETLDRIKKGSV